MRLYRFCILYFSFVILAINTADGQKLRKFNVESFVQDPLDLTARNDQHKFTDDNGALYSIIKVKSSQQGDNLETYRFDFGATNSFTKNHPETEELWVYVQKGAKTVTISRNGYETIAKYDLGITTDDGSTYLMWLSTTTRLADTQIVMFQIKPTNAKASIKVKSDRKGSIEDDLGKTDGMGFLVKNLPFGTYTYWVTSENYYSAEGRFTLNNQVQSHLESLTLQGNYGTITLTVDADAEIFVDGVNLGFRSWTGNLKASDHQVECRQLNHHPSTQTITVLKNETRTINLTPPIPITEQTVTLCPDSKHPHQIDMGDDIKWACCNIGAKSPSENGDYFAWGETQTKDYYTWDTYKWGGGTLSRLTKYCTDSSTGQLDNKNQLEPSDDAATYIWGETWRIPTSQEFVDLTLNCEWTRTTVEGATGYIVTADNGNSIFFPLNGDIEKDKPFGIGAFGHYWSSNLDSNPSFGKVLNQSNSFCYMYQILRYMGLGIRPVTNKQ